ncbi:hypothetical protein VPH35_044309 [Triticum aestivum]
MWTMENARKIWSTQCGDEASDERIIGGSAEEEHGEHLSSFTSKIEFTGSLRKSTTEGECFNSYNQRYKVEVAASTPPSVHLSFLTPTSDDPSTMAIVPCVANKFYTAEGSDQLVVVVSGCSIWGLAFFEQVDLTPHSVCVLTSLKVKNVGLEPIPKVLLAFLNIQAKNMAVIRAFGTEGKVKGLSSVLSIEVVEPSGVPPEPAFFQHH